MIGGGRALLKPRAHGRDAVRIVKADQALSVRVVERQRIAQAVRPFRRRLTAPDLEFQPIALIEPVGAAVKGEKKLERMFIATTYLSYHGRII
jgi:hypothetical protein